MLSIGGTLWKAYTSGGAREVMITHTEVGLFKNMVHFSR